MVILRISPFKRRAVIALLATFLLVTSDRLLAADDTDAVLLQELKKRDAVIAELLKRVEQLESRVRDTVVYVDSQPDGAVVMKQIDDLQSQLETLTDEDIKAEGEQVAGAEGKKKPRGPGAVEVDPLAAERALERTLTNQGALLLPTGVYEIEPFFSYSRRDIDNPLFARLLGPPDIGIAVGTQRVKRDALSFGLGYKVGLPYESQLEVTVPYRIVHQEVVSSQALGGSDAVDDTGSTIGDVSIGLAKTLMREDGWKPDLIGRFVWNTSTGDRVDNGVATGIGFDELTASLTALKRQDPLAFTGSVSYTHTLEKDDIQPGDQFGLSFGASIAASPSTSLSFSLSQVFSQETEFNGRNIDGSSGNSSQFLFGWSSSLTRQTLLSFSAGVGLTDDAPDYSFNVSLPIRFY